MARAMSIGGVASESGVNLETIRYYERIGLLPKPPRSAGGHREYDDKDLRRLVFIRRGRELGFGLEDIRELLRISGQDGPVCGSVLKVAAPHLETVRRKIADLTRLEAMLAQAVEGCTGELNAPECPVLGMLSEHDRPSQDIAGR